MSRGSTAVSSSEEVIWMWTSSNNPWGITALSDWKRYSDVENMIIEEAFASGKAYAMLDDYHINFSLMIQASNNNNDKQRPVERWTENSSKCPGRAERATFVPISVNPSVSNRPEAFGNFIWEAYLLGRWRDVPQEILVERAAQGIIEEGKKVGKQREGEKMAGILLEKKYSTRKEIWRCCAYLYSLGSFLYQRLNETLRLVNSKEHEQEWRSRLETLGLFAWFLFDFPQDAKEFEGYLYRGATMAEDTIDTYKTAAETGELLAFPTFASTSRNRSRAKQFGNTLFIISIVRSRETSVDISDVSEYPDEEEHLLIPGFLFKVTRVEFNDKKKKYRFYLQDCNNQ